MLFEVLWTTLIGSYVWVWLSGLRLEICNSPHYARSQHLYNQMSTYHQETATESDEDIGELHEVQENGSHSAQPLRTLTDIPAGRLSNSTLVASDQESTAPGTDNGDQTAVSSGLILATAAALYGLVLAIVVALRGIFPAPGGGAIGRGPVFNRPPVESDPYDADDEAGF
ncbi:hypothetical protein BDN72DRAFT_862038 [Pluteus cervinus]|uniref:Uncharacterized protein n=1 Tax=Pluteus cervinus TaxID=181527 RepID=A0ACD3ADP9_9AGAR|nr:hypothetical protein BDN72DRAFT_862038 [Pluteus cervinus]